MFSGARAVTDVFLLNSDTCTSIIHDMTCIAVLGYSSFANNPQGIPTRHSCCWLKPNLVLLISLTVVLLISRLYLPKYEPPVAR
jgi:hypothetical protein